MAFLYTNYLFTKSVIDSLESKYKEQIALDDNKIFLYSNTYNIIEAFRLSKSKIKTYDLYTKISTTKQDLFIYNLIKQTKNNNYQPNNILFLYSIATSLILKEHLNKCEPIKENSNLLDYEYAKISGVDISGRKLKNIFPSGFMYSFLELDFLSSSLTDTYLLPQLTKYMQVSVNELRKCIYKNPFRSIKQKYKDLTCYKKSYTKYKNFVYKNKYKKLLNLKVIKDEQELNLDDIINQAYKESLEFIDAINDLLYFDKNAKILEFVEKYEWNSIKEQEQFVKKQKKLDKLRHKRYHKK